VKCIVHFTAVGLFYTLRYYCMHGVRTQHVIDTKTYTIAYCWLSDVCKWRRRLNRLWLQ